MRPTILVSLSRLLLSMLVVLAAMPASAARGNADIPPNNNCRNTGSFPAWLDDFAREAAAQGLSQRALSALSGVRLDKKVIARDRQQGVFSQDFLTFAGRMVSDYRLKNGRALLKKYSSLFQQIERQFGVPGPVITAFWALETDFGANNGDFPTLTALASLAYDCRRPALFRPQLLDALRLIDNGDLSAGEMRGAWAGELGQVQFLPSDYYRNAVDFDGDGRRNLINSVPDALASAASLLRQFGWRPGEPWLEEVRVPAELPWEQADVYIQKARIQWARWGVTRADGSALPADDMPSALLLPMGHQGPAFLAYPNFQVYLEWNDSLVYTITAAYLATRLAGAPRVGAGRGQVNSLSVDQIKQLQNYLVRRGLDVGEVDGIIGERTRAAVKRLQLELGVPADSWPTVELLHRIR